jgi:hypothetical protein
MTPNQIGALTTLIFVAVFYIGTPLWADRRGRNWKLWLVLAFLFPVISLIVLFILPNRKAKDPAFSAAKKKEGKPSELEAVNSAAIPEQKIQTQPILDTTKRINEVISSEPSDDAMDDVLADFEDMLMSKSILHGLGIKGLVGVRLQAEKYDDDGAESFKCWIIVESTAIKKLSDDLNEQVSDTVQDFVRENDFDSAISEAGFDPDLFNWWPVRVENVGVATAAKDVPDATKVKDPVTTNPSAKKSYTEEFKKEVVHTALTAGTSLSEIARMYEINLTLVRNWKAKYGAEILKEINGDEDNDTGRGNDIPTPTVIWHIDRAKFVFSDPAEYKQWKKEKKVFFEFSPSGADDGGEAVFADVEGAADDFEVTEDRGLVKISLEKDGPVISAWVGVLAETVDDLDQDTLTDWSNDQSGWACCTIHLGDFDASIEEDDGGDWRLVEGEQDEDTDGSRSTQDVENADPILNEINGVLADFDDLLDRKNVLYALKIDGLLSVYLQAERYSDDGSDAYKVWIVLESDGVKKISADLDEQVQDIVYDFINDNGFGDAMTEAGYDPELFNWWPVRIDYVGRDETAESGTDELSEPSSSIEKISIVNLIDKFNDLIGAEIEGIENKLYERGILKKLTGDANAQVSVWLTTHGEGDTYISLYVDIESEKAKIKVSYSEEFTDYISGKFHEAVDELSKEDNDALNANFFGVVVRLNNEEI